MIFSLIIFGLQKPIKRYNEIIILLGKLSIY